MVTEVQVHGSDVSHVTDREMVETGEEVLVVHEMEIQAEEEVETTREEGIINGLQ